MVNGKQLTVAWHVDDLKVSHAEESALDEFIAMMEKEFGKSAPLSVSCGRVQEYLGMTMDFSEKGRVEIKMADYVKTMLNDVPPPPPPPPPPINGWKGGDSRGVTPVQGEYRRPESLGYGKKGHVCSPGDTGSVLEPARAP